MGRKSSVYTQRSTQVRYIVRMSGGEIVGNIQLIHRILVKKGHFSNNGKNSSKLVHRCVSRTRILSVRIVNISMEMVNQKTVTSYPMETIMRNASTHTIFLVLRIFLMLHTVDSLKTVLSRAICGNAITCITLSTLQNVEIAGIYFLAHEAIISSDVSDERIKVIRYSIRQ